jgi:hypothetical protein
MFSFEFFITFIFIGLAIRLFLGYMASVIVVILISVGWSFVYGPWAILTFVELMIGWAGGQAAANTKSKKESADRSKTVNTSGQDIDWADDLEESKDDEPKDWCDYDYSVPGVIFDRVVDFMERNESYARILVDILRYKIFLGIDHISDFENLSEENQKKIMVNAATALALEQIMNFECPKVESLQQSGVSSCEFEELYEEILNELLTKYENLNWNGRNLFIEDGYRLIYGDEWEPL